MSTVDVEAAICFAEDGRNSHQLWVDWHAKYGAGYTGPDTLERHIEWVARYDHILDILRGSCGYKEGQPI